MKVSGPVNELFSKVVINLNFLKALLLYMLLLSSISNKDVWFILSASKAAA